MTKDNQDLQRFSRWRSSELETIERTLNRRMTLIGTALSSPEKASEFAVTQIKP
jgi:hypothetical protein